MGRWDGRKKKGPWGGKEKVEERDKREAEAVKDRKKQKRRDHEVEIMRAKSEKVIAKCNMIKSLSSLGLSQEEILEQLKDF